MSESFIDTVCRTCRARGHIDLDMPRLGWRFWMGGLRPDDYFVQCPKCGSLGVFRIYRTLRPVVVFKPSGKPSG